MPCKELVRPVPEAPTGPSTAGSSASCCYTEAVGLEADRAWASPVAAPRSTTPSPRTAPAPAEPFAVRRPRRPAPPGDGRGRAARPGRAQAATETGTGRPGPAASGCRRARGQHWPSRYGPTCWASPGPVPAEPTRPVPWPVRSVRTCTRTGQSSDSRTSCRCPSFGRIEDDLDKPFPASPSRPVLPIEPGTARHCCPWSMSRVAPQQWFSLPPASLFCLLHNQHSRPCPCLARGEVPASAPSSQPTCEPIRHCDCACRASVAGGCQIRLQVPATRSASRDACRRTCLRAGIDRAQWRTLHVARQEALIKALWPAATKGDPKAAQAVRGIMDSQAAARLGRPVGIPRGALQLSG